MKRDVNHHFHSHIRFKFRKPTGQKIAKNEDFKVPSGTFVI